jgi:ABC-type multidrug transport system permease subunit
MRSLVAMMRKEFLHIGRDSQLIGFILGLPILLLVLFGYALRLKVDHLPIAVWDRDRSLFSLEVKDRLERVGDLRVVEVDSEETIRDWLRRGKARLGLIIPPDFSQRLADGKQTTFPLLVDGTMPTLAQAGLYGARVLTSDEAAADFVVDDPDHPAPPLRKSPLAIEQIILFNPHLRDSDFFLPGTIGIVIMLVTLTLSTGLVREKEQQTIEQLLATPITRFALIAGKMIPYGVIAALDFVIVSVLGRWIFALPFRGSLLSVALLAALFILALLALGALISTLSETQLQANFMAVFVIVPSVLMSGFVFPVEGMPTWLKPVAWSLPMTYFIDAIRGLTLKGVGVSDVVRDYAALVVFAVLFTVLSVTRFRKQLA